MKQTLYTPSEVNQLVGMLEELIEDVESLSNQLKRAELINKTLLAQSSLLFDFTHNKDMTITVH